MTRKASSTGASFGAYPSVDRAECARMRVLFVLGAFAVLAVALRLVQLQVGGHDAAVLSVRSKVSRETEVAAQRATIVDRSATPLAHDRPVYEAWGELYLRSVDEGARLKQPELVDLVVSDLATALEFDHRAAARMEPAGPSATLRARLDERLPKRFEKLREQIRAARDAGQKVLPKDLRVDFPIHSELSDAAALLALRDIDRRTTRRDLPYALYVHLKLRHERVYAEPELTAGLVGLIREHHGDRGVERIGASGLERLAIVAAGEPGTETERVNASGAPFWSARSKPAQPAPVLHTTIDLALQRIAQRYLHEEAVTSVIDRYGSPPDWGGIVAVDIASGGVLAMASFLQDPAQAETASHVWSGAFTPTQYVFEPGSVVKPLVLALALQRGAIDWNDSVDCSDGVIRVAGLRGSRRIVDTHPCQRLTPRGVLIHSSNIGATKFGMRLGAEGLEEYIERYGFRRPVGLPIPERTERNFRATPIPQLARNEIELYVGPSLCFGYETPVTLAHLARAYLSFLSGRPRELRLLDAIEVHGEREATAIADAGSEPFLSAATIGRVSEAMVAMVDGEEGATAPRLTTMLARLGVPKGHIGGKTGTSEYPPGPGPKIRTASFAGFAPAHDPRVLVICVLQKKNAGSFYGGSYAAPAAGRLLLEALRIDEERKSARSRVSALRTGTEARGRSAPLHMRR